MPKDRRLPVLFYLLLALMTTLAAQPAIGEPLKPFISDGCSVFPDGTMEQQTLWVNCCIQHDLSYWKGGTYKERLQADLSLEQCVNAVGQPDIAKIMLTGVRIGGSPYFPTTYRWGYGWPYPRGYKALTATEREQVSDQLAQLEIMIHTLLEQIQQHQ